MAKPAKKPERLFRPAQNPPPLALPLVGARISCGGFSSVADDFIERELDLNELCIQNPPETYLVRAAGESMAPEIEPGDYLVVDRSLTPAHRDTVVCVLDGEFALKRLVWRRGKAFLESANPRYRPIRLNGERQFEVWGVVAASVRLHRA